MPLKSLSLGSHYHHPQGNSRDICTASRLNRVSVSGETNSVTECLTINFNDLTV